LNIFGLVEATNTPSFFVSGQPGQQVSHHGGGGSVGSLNTSNGGSSGGTEGAWGVNRAFTPMASENASVVAAKATLFSKNLSMTV
jgi:hypothetical protein